MQYPVNKIIIFLCTYYNFIIPATLYILASRTQIPLKFVNMHRQIVIVKE